MKTTCLFPKCNIVQHTRGLCRRHYQCAAKLVAFHKTTWEALEKAKKTLPKKRTRYSAAVEYFLSK